MTGCDLFVHLVLRLRHYADAAVLWVLLKERADIKEVKTTSMLMSHVQLAGTVDRVSAHRSIKSLQATGLIRVRVHRKTATLITVDRDAVLDLLRSPLDERLPGLSLKVFPFLQSWVDDRQVGSARPVRPAAEAQSGGPALDAHAAGPERTPSAV